MKRVLTLALTASSVLAMPAMANGPNDFSNYFVSASATSDSQGNGRAAIGYNGTINGVYSGGTSTDTTMRNPTATVGVSGPVTADTTLKSIALAASVSSPVGQVGAGPVSVQSSALASLANASVGVSTTQFYNNFHDYPAGSTVASLHDILNFTVAGASATTRTTVGVQFIIDGQWVNNLSDGGFGNQYTANLGVSLCLNQINQFSCSGSNGLNNDGYGASASVIWSSNTHPVPTIDFLRNETGFTNGISWGSWAGSTPELLTFTGYFDLVGANPTLNPYIRASLDCQAAANCSFGNTAKLRFLNLPSNVSFTSASGTFLSAVNNPMGGVPEPASWALMIAGFGAVGAAARRRSTVRITYA